MIPAGSAGVKDPYVHLLESQSAMSMLMMQMAREMNQRSLQQQLPQQQQQQVGQDPNQPQAAGQQGGQTGAYQKDMKMDEKWIPGLREEKNCQVSRIGWRSSVVG